MQHGCLREDLIFATENPRSNYRTSTDGTLSITRSRGKNPCESHAVGRVQAIATAVSVIHHQRWSYVVEGEIYIG